MNFDRYRKAPFHLDDSAIEWVRTSLEALSPDERLRQLFNLRMPSSEPAAVEAVSAFRPGSVTRVPGPDLAFERGVLDQLNAAVPTPLLVSGDIEGSRMSLPGGQEWPNPIALAAIDDLAVTEEVSRMMAQEARAFGFNWSFTPVLDINAAFRSAIVATRGFGADVDRIARHAMVQMETFQREGLASAVKHWPGEGYDDRDQHLLTTINPLTMDEWEATFGRLYRDAIEKGVYSVMSAHIALPAFLEQQQVPESVERYRPASLSRHLTEHLLRENLGFNGLVVSDSSNMAGIRAWSHRSIHLPELVAAGCDVILFSMNPAQDLEYLEIAVAEGRLSVARVDEAVGNQLALKAALGLHRPTALPDLPERNEDRPLEIASRAPVLVKDVHDLLPLDAQTHKRVLVVSGGIVFPFTPDPMPFALPEMLAERGFEVTMFEKGMTVAPEDFDLMIYLFGEETLLTRGHIFLDWLKLTGNFLDAMQRHWHDIPTLMISFGYPYLLYDAPRVPAYINAWSTTETMQQAVCNLLLGNQPFTGTSPVDPFCGLPDAKY